VGDRFIVVIGWGRWEGKVKTGESMDEKGQKK
jgi:hypothetical protein